MGGIFILEAETGNLIWRAGPGGSSGTSGVFKSVPDITYSIPSDVTIIDRNDDGLHDRLYVGDTGGQVWRVDIGNSSLSNWQVYKLASIRVAAGGEERKLLYPPGVV